MTNRTIQKLFSFLLFFIPLTTYASLDRNLLSVSKDNPLLPFILLAGSIMAIITFYYPRFGLYILLFFVLIATDMPIGKNADKIQRGVTIRIEDIVLVLVSAGWLLHRARTRSLAIVKHIPLYKAIIPLTIIIILATLIGFFQGTVEPFRGFFFSLKRLEYFWIFLMTVNIMEKDNEVKIAVNVLLGISTIMAFIGIVQSVLFPITAAGGATATAGMFRANTLGDFLLMVIGIICGLLAYNKNKRRFLLLSGVLISLMISLILTKSRGAYVCIPPLFFVIAFLSKNKRVLGILISLTVVGGIYIGIKFMYTDDSTTSMLAQKHVGDISNQFESITDVATKGAKADSSLDARIQGWKNALPKMVQYPFFGRGCGSIRLGYLDNQYIRELYETGLFGFLAFMFMNLYLLYFMLNFFLTTEIVYNKSLALGFIAGHIAILGHGMTISNFYTIFNMETFWFLAAIIVILYYNEYCESLARLKKERVETEKETIAIRESNDG